MQERSYEMIALAYFALLGLVVWFSSKTLGFWKSMAFGLVLFVVTCIPWGVHREQWRMEHARRARERAADRDVILYGAVPDRPEVPYCTSNNEAMQGGHVYAPNKTGFPMHVWVPGRCRLQYFNISTARECLVSTNRSILFLGDSLLLGVSNSLHYGAAMSKGLIGGSKFNFGMYVPGHEDDLSPIRFSWLSSAYVGDPADANDTLRNPWVADADLVMVHHGLWDLGKYSEGAVSFYYKVKQRLQRLKGAMKTGAQLVLFELHNIQRHRCEDYFEVCHHCNHPKKVQAYREALRMAAACTDTPTYFTYKIGENMITHSKDGNHYDEVVRAVEKDLLLNAMCPRPNGEEAMQWNDPGQCDEDASIAKWKAVPEAMVGKECTRIPWYNMGNLMTGTPRKKRSVNQVPEELDTLYLKQH
eukprot:TRINITY_DN34273_c0_g1_i1.p1 TRINITY_DN34273_c0_g1~~TRINITY_DN34273_c0_g1_i1.p1  ORF type:complete len:416 (+),score=154.51 TRINITY_DN34273_c0_g1_i1:64-1311(+)